MRKLYGNALAGYLDFCAGAFIVFILGYLFDYKPPVFYYLAGSMFAVIPDIDLAYMLARKGFIYGNHHQFITHRPLFMLPLVFFTTLAASNKFLAIAAVLCVVWHYVHDTEGVGGGGISWFWPFSNKYYSLFGAREPGQFVVSALANPHNSFVENTWLKPSAQAISELVLGTVMLDVVLIYLYNLEAAVVASYAVFMVTAFMWALFYLDNMGS